MLFWQRLGPLFALALKICLKLTKLKFWIKDLAELSRQPGVDPVLWLLVIALMHIFNEEEGEQAKYKIYSLRRTGTPGSACLSQVCVQGENI